MDCNRDEAARSRSIAEKKFMQQDYAGARKFALKARQLFPDLEGLVQFVAVMEVHATAHEKLQCGEMDWYGIMQSDPSADEASLRKQYRKLALILHPDKNKSLGAEAAFKYISEAWTILSDKIKKAAYDNKRQPPAPKPAPPKKPGAAPQSKQTVKQPPRKKQTQKTTATTCPPQQSSHHVSSPGMTFWTACPDCKLQYEYHIVYKHKTLCCPFCLKPFFAKELAVILNGQVLWPPPPEQNGVDANATGGLSSVNGYTSGAKFNASPGNVSFCQAGKAQVNPEARKENIVAESPCPSKEQEKKKEMDQPKCKFSGESDSDPLVARLNAEMRHKLSPETSLEEGCNFADNSCTLDNSKSSTADVCITPGQKEGGSMDIPFVDLESYPDVSPLKKARVDSQGSLQEQVLKGISKTKLSETGCKEENGDHYVTPCLKAKTTMGSLIQESSMVESHMTSTRDTEMDCLVPDSDFYVFDNDRTEHHFASGQVWACYDDDDGLPRYYTRIVKVISQKPFKIQYTWLEARSSSEEVMSWLDSGFSYTCGEFKLGKTLTGDSVCMFSHIMTFEKGQKGGLMIYPRKGEIWALYKDWASLITKDDKHGYELVEVLTDFSDETGVQVCLLVRVEGFKSVYRRLSDIVYRVLPNEMRRFSHNIPVHQLTAGEVPDCVKGCFELDPASTPRK
ncbi:hypothetical protein GOP47_0030460 [Adiantum capillus-veneris]|nr:hypothetical protein GOP47_0030460 [Adiantum capillus-veneris]